MAVTFREMTTCYKCQGLIMAERGAVHPLCEKCGSNFDVWFTEELRKIDNA